MTYHVVLTLLLWRTLFASGLLPPEQPVFQSSSRISATSTTSDAMASLTKGFVENAIDDACHYIGEKVQTLRTNGGLTVRRIRDQDWHIGSEEMVGKDVDASDYLKSRTPWHFGISVRNAHNNSIIGRVTFYVAYSSWSGRIIYIDRMDCKGLNDETEELLLRILADVALALDCVRLTWRHTTTPKWHSAGTNQPEMHGEVLTLSMDKDAMAKFVSDSPLKNVVPLEGGFSKDLVDTAFSTCLDKVNNIPDATFLLRLAQKQEDLETIERLVQGLADYVKEPDAVEMTAQDYLKDGFALDNPLWYCLLVDKVNEDGSRYTCGYAFVFVGYVLGEGRFIYLEDLYLEVDHRGDGGGKTTMKALAGLCQALQCSRLYWQALDWNTSGLSFYNKIGAKVHEGEKTSRYAGEALKAFADHGSRSSQ